MHKYNNQDHAMMTSMLTVKNIIAGEALYDIWNVNEDAEYHEAGSTDSLEALKSVRLVPQRVQGDDAQEPKSRSARPANWLRTSTSRIPASPARCCLN